MPFFECGFEANDIQYYLNAGWYRNNTNSYLTSTAGEVHTTLSGNGGAVALRIYGTVTTPQFGLGGRWLHLWYHPQTTSSSLAVHFLRQGAANAAVNFGSDGGLSIRRGIWTGTILDWQPFNPNVDHWIAIEANVKNSGGQITVYLDGTQVAQATGDTCNTANEDWDQLTFTNANSAVIDDLIITTESEGILTDSIIPVLVPTSDSTPLELTPSTGSDHYALVDEIPPVTTDYDEATAANQEDNFGMGNLAFTPDLIHCVGVWVDVARDGAITDCKIIMTSNTTVDKSPSLAIPGTGTYSPLINIWNTDPDTSSAWIASGVNAMDNGVEFL